MATFKEALEYAAKNPNSDFAKSFGKEVASGRHDIEASKLGFDTTPIKQKFTVQTPKEEPKGFEKVIGKIADFTGGKELGQGLATTILQPEFKKQLDETLKSQIEIQGQILQKIKEKKALGEDTSRLEMALGDITTQLQNTGENSDKILNPYELTPKKVIGDALQLGTTIVGAGTLPGAGSKVVGAKTLGEGLIQGAKTGAVTGAGFGASTGASQALQDDKSIGGIVKDTLGGALIGAGTGGLLGGLTGGITGAVRGKKISQVTKRKNFIEDLVSPKTTTAVKEQALKEGRITEQGLLTASKITPSKRDLQLADAVKDIVNPKKSLSENISLIDKNLDEINTGVKAYVSSKKVPFNTKQLTTQLNKGKKELNIIFAGDKQAQKTYDAVVKEFLKNIKSKDTAGLFEARQKFDKIPAIKKLLDSQGLGENVKKQIVLEVRGQANNYVAELLPKGNKFRDTLLKESKMIEAIQNMAEKGASSIGKNKLQELTQKYPFLKAVAGGLAAGLGLGAVGVGNSIIGSSD